jgi:hypothetical protein
VKSRSSLTWIATPKAAEAEHGGPWDTVGYDNPPMVLIPLGNRELHPNSRTNDAADPMIILERCAFRYFGKLGRGQYHPRVEARPRGRWYAAPKKEVAPKQKVAPNGTSRAEESAPTAAKSIDRSPALRSKQIAPTEANWPTEVICTEIIASHRAKPIAPNEAGRAEGKAKKPTARRGRKSKGSSCGTCFFGDDEDNSEG